MVLFTFLAQVLLIFYETRESSMFMLLPMSLPFIFMSGFIWPKAAIPHLVNAVSLFIPSVPMSDALIKMNQMGAKFYQVKGNLIILVLLCIFYYFLAVLVVKKIMKTKI